MLTGTVAKARGEYVRTHFKNTREVAAAISGAYTIRKKAQELVGRELELCRSAGSLDGVGCGRGIEVRMSGMEAEDGGPLSDGQLEEEENMRRGNRTRC